MIKKLRQELQYFSSQTRNFRVLVLVNLLFAFALPVTDVFVAAYIMRNSNDPTKVFLYQLMIYTGIPLTFLLNGFLISRVNIKTLYSVGMMLCGVSMLIMMSLSALNLTGIAIAGLTMGMAFGLYWANRDFLSLANTHDGNRNYYYGLETFLYTIVATAVPVLIGLFIQRWSLSGQSQLAYQWITAGVFVVTIGASIICFQGRFESPPARERFIYLKFHPLWKKFLAVAAFKGMVQGFLVTAPAMLVMRLIGGEGALGSMQSVGAVVAAVAMYFVGRYSQPRHRLYILSAGLVFFLIASLANSMLFNAAGVVLFMMFLLVAKPLMDLAYFPIQYNVINLLAHHEGRSDYSYILNHEVGIFAGRLFGAVVFLWMAYAISTEVALRYAILVIALIQLLSVTLVRSVINDCAAMRLAASPMPEQRVVG